MQCQARRCPTYLMLISLCPVAMAAGAKAQSRSGSMRPGGLGSTQLIQKLAQLAWYWWPPYSSLKLSVSELNACQSERVKYYTPERHNKPICAHRRKGDGYSGYGQGMRCFLIPLPLTRNRDLSTTYQTSYGLKLVLIFSILTFTYSMIHILFFMSSTVVCSSVLM